VYWRQKEGIKRERELERQWTLLGLADIQKEGVCCKQKLAGEGIER